ncbi:type II toxin-antitoxin system HipA family toxin [Saccharospirillum salsuginis]|uniref:Kinase n=1 Tax=Saccharospirillum salsuginis TaxID=418750 RepID=A0A918NI06_9GAMM|nr:HipA domain-containing protein [Saccharospirillum salsuginis]GGX68961.1 putative kinase [Saccharospirillum salsuginis]
MTYDRCLATLKAISGREAASGYSQRALKQVFGTSKVTFPLSYDRQEFFSKSVEYSKGISISGVQEKLSLRLDRASNELVVTRNNGEYILKPSPEAFPNAAENEHAAMLASQKIGIETALCTLVPFKTGELAYLTRRFDRLESGDKRPQEDLLQIGGLPPKAKYDVSYEKAGELVDQATGGKRAVKLDLFRRVLFAYAIGNNDLHTKNLSLQRAVESSSRFYDKLTPNYDVLFVQAFDNTKEGQFMACDLLTDPETGEEEFTEPYQEYGFYTGYDFLELGRRYGLPERAVIRAIRNQVDSQGDMIELIQSSYMPEEMKREAEVIVVGRCRAISTGIDR